MKKSNVILKCFILVALIGLFSITGCKKDNSSSNNNNNNNTTTPDYEAATDNSEAEISSNDVINVSDAVVNTFQAKSGESVVDTFHYKWFCADVTRIKLGNGKRKFIVDFGTTDKTCFGLKTRRGQIILFVTGRYYYSGFEDSITFNNFYVNNKHIEGTHVVKNITTPGGILTWTVNAAFKVTRPDNLYHTWNSIRQRQLVGVNLADTVKTGWDTNLPYVYKITGSANGVNIKTNAYTATIIIPLIKAFDCWWIEQGSIDFQVTGKPLVTLDYGNGTCDNKATVTVNGKTYNITLP